MLAGMYYERTGDLDTIRAIWPNIQAALRWIDEQGDRDGDGFVEYQAETERGLSNQGWKDSHDSVFHADGQLAEGPIALCEVQGYVFAAKRHAARLATALGFGRLADTLRRRGGGACASASRRRSGAPMSPLTRWRWTVPSNRAACAHRTQAMSCSPAWRASAVRRASRAS